MKSKKNILVLTYWSFENALIQTYTLPYVKQISEIINKGNIYIFCLSSQSTYNEKTLRQIEKLKAQNIYILNFTYKKFGLVMSLKMLMIIKYLIWFCWLKKIDTIHAWCTPGGAIGYFVSLFSRKKLVLDSFEPHAETMAEGNTWRKNSFAYNFLFRLEKLQLKRATEVICAAEGMIEHSKNIYGIEKSNYFIKPACVDLNLFNFQNETILLKRSLKLKKNVCVYAGKFGGIYLEQEVFDFFKVANDFWKNDFSVVLLTSHSDEEIKNYCNKSKLDIGVITKVFVPHYEVPKYIALGDFGICPVKPLPSKQFCTPIKNGEYWAMGLPVVITKNISEDSEIVQQNNIGYVLQKLTNEEYLNATIAINTLIKDSTLKNKIRKIAEEKRNFNISRKIYQTIYS